MYEFKHACMIFFEAYEFKHGKGMDNNQQSTKSSGGNGIGNSNNDSNDDNDEKQRQRRWRRQRGSSAARTKNRINKAKPIKQPCTNPRQVNLPFLLLGMMEWLVVPEAWFKVNDISNETVDLGKKMVPNIEQNSSG
jgi:hypothetical protein